MRRVCKVLQPKQTYNHWLNAIIIATVRNTFSISFPANRGTVFKTQTKRTMIHSLLFIISVFCSVYFECKRYCSCEKSRRYMHKGTYDLQGMISPNNGIIRPLRLSTNSNAGHWLIISFFKKWHLPGEYACVTSALTCTHTHEY